MSDRRLMLGDTPPYNVVEITHSEAVAGDILAFDGVSKRLFRIIGEEATDLPRECIPIGVVVIPTNHDVYGDSSCGVMSLKEMDCSTPDTGSTSHQYMHWGHHGNDISDLPNLDQAPIVGTGSNVGNANSIVTDEYNSPYLPSDKFSAVQCPHDTDAYYYSSNSSYRQAPSPYLTDGSRNPAYYQTTSPSSSNNCLADFDGKGNSEILWGLATAQSTWKTDSTITNSYDDNYLPAACCCWRYHTDGTQQGDWYLPAMGELGYIMPPFNKIDEAITKMRNAYGSSVGVTLGTTNNYYWSSSEYSSRSARIVYTSDGSVGSPYKGSNYYVRAFLKVSPLDLS